jgi:hypothetical protein
MKAIAGAGALLSHGQEIPVTYDLVESAASSRFSAEGEVFGDARALIDVYNTGPCNLLLETGRAVQVVLVVCHLHGAAEVRVKGPVKWG